MVPLKDKKARVLTICKLNLGISDDACGRNDSGEQGQVSLELLFEIFMA